jgi:RimJ/RimL family protein N-acetyltransferase
LAPVEFHEPEPALSDGVVTLRPWREDDVPALVAALQDPEIPRWTRVPSPYTERDARWFLATHRADRDEMSLAIVSAANGDELLGGIGFRLPRVRVGELGYWVAAGARGRGIATRAVNLLARWGFDELGLARVQILADPRNAASRHVAERAGFTSEGLLRSWDELKGERVDYLMFSLLPGDLR